MYTDEAPKGWGSESESRSVLSDPLGPHGLYSPRNSPGQNTGVGSLSLLQGIFPTQGWNPDLPHCRRILSQLSHQGSPNSLSGREEKLSCQPPIEPTQQGKAIGTCEHGLQSMGSGLRSVGSPRPQWGGTLQQRFVPLLPTFPPSSTATSGLWTLARCAPVRRRRLLPSSCRGYCCRQKTLQGQAALVLGLGPALSWLSGSFRSSGSL